MVNNSSKKALLIVAGGRGIPDVLALLCIQPDYVTILTSEEGWGDEVSFREVAESLLQLKEDIITVNVKSFDIGEIKKECLAICEASLHREWDWTFSIGSCPKIMGIGAYEIAKKKDIPCIYMDTQHEVIVSLVKNIGVSSQEFFHMKVLDYMRAQHRTFLERKGKTVPYRKAVEEWGNVAGDLVLSPDTAQFTLIMRDKKVNEQVLLPEALAESSLVQNLHGIHKLINLTTNSDGTVSCSFSSSNSARFLGTGDWLEVYTWHEAVRANFADDCQWGYKIVDGTAENELDLALMYRAQLIIAECKTDYEPFAQKREYLDTLDSNAHLLGGPYVTKLFITYQPKTRKAFKSFKEQADKRRIVVVTAEDLPHIGAILKQEAVKPTYSRI